MSDVYIDMNNNMKSNNLNYELSQFMIEYQNKRMKMWNPYADIKNYNEDIKKTNSKFEILLMAIEYVENQ